MRVLISIHGTAGQAWHPSCFCLPLFHPFRIRRPFVAFASAVHSATEGETGHPFAAVAVPATIFSPSVKIMRTGNTENQRVRRDAAEDEIGEKEIEAKRTRPRRT